MADDIGGGNAEPTHELVEVGGQIARMITTVSAVGIAVAAERQGDDAQLRRQMLHHRYIRAPGIRIAMDQDDGKPIRRPLLDIAQGDGVGQTNGLFN